MTGSTRQRRRSLEPPAVRVSRSGAGRPLPRTRAGEPRVQVRALPEGLRGAAPALLPKCPGRPLLVGPSVCGHSASYAHDASVRPSLAFPPATLNDSPTAQNPTTLPNTRWAVEPMAAASERLSKVAGQGEGRGAPGEAGRAERRRRELAPARRSSSLGAPGLAPGLGAEGWGLSWSAQGRS